MKPALLFVSPTAPTSSGQGLGMRAHAVLKALSGTHRIFLLALNHPPRDATAIRDLCAEAVFHPVGLWNPRDMRLRRVATRWPVIHRRLFPEPYEWRRLARATIPYPFSVSEFDLAHVFRLYATPVFDRLPDAVSWKRSQLDLDELESRTRRRLAVVHRLNGDAAAAAQCEIEAEQFERIEAEKLRLFDRLFVCSPVDRRRILDAGLHPAPEVLPNIAPAAAAQPAAPHDGFRFLFVGNLGYAPNADAVLHFCRDILPRVRAVAGTRVTFDIVGAGASLDLAHFVKAVPDARLTGRVDDLAPVYAATDAVVVPLRAGGGTRIKVLEAFAHLRPVVSTPEGIEGIAALDGTHALVAEGAEPFAGACVRLINDAPLRSALASHARELVISRYSEGTLTSVLAGGAAAHPAEET